MARLAFHARHRAIAAFAFKCIVSVGLVAYLVSREGIGEAFAVARRLPATTLATAALLVAAYFALGAARWLFVVHALGARLSFARALRITTLSMFASQFLPSTIGADAVRAWATTRAGIPAETTINSVILDRAAYLVVLSLVAAAAASLQPVVPLPASLVGALWALSLASTAAVGVAALLPAGAYARTPAIISAYAGRLRGHVRRVFGSAGVLGRIGASVVAAQAAFSVAVLLVVNATGASLTLVPALALLPVVVLLSAIPVSVGGWGVREISMVSILAHAGVPAASALVASVAIGLLTLVLSLPGGALMLASRTRR